VTVGHSAVIHGCTIEDRVVDRHAGDAAERRACWHDSIIAAGTLLTEGTRIPAGSLVMGRPGKVKRPLNEAELAEIRRLSQAYVS
jgi:carbonic anhydrase/acetyltransferase-like protein (isoleucine patch superfamily)